MPDVWPFLPVPESRETLMFATDIQQTYTDEMRYSMRGGRQFLAYSYRKTNSLQNMAQKFRNDPYGEWLVPVWEQASALGAVASADTALNADITAEYDGMVLIYGGCDDYTTATVSSVTSTVNLSASVGQDFTNATAVPLRTCVPVNGANLTRINHRHSEVLIEWRASAEFTPTGAGYATYGGFPYLECSTAVIRAISGSIIHPTAEIDSELGPVVLAPIRSLVNGIYTVSINMSNRTDISELRKFIGDMRGQDAAFWIADWEGKLDLDAALMAGATTADFTPVFEDVADYVGRYINFGTEYRQVSSSLEFGGLHQITFSSLGTGTSTARLLRKVRLNTDRIIFNHRRGLASSVDFTVREAA